jgi:site-specific recombinase XerD
MKIGSMKEVFLSNAKDIYLFDCRVAGLDSQTVGTYREALNSFITFTGDILVKELTPDHVRIYIGNLSDGPSEGEEHIRSVINHYAVIHTWIRWLYAQKFLIERSNSDVTPPRFTNERGGVMYYRQSQFSPNTSTLRQKIIEQ